MLRNVDLSEISDGRLYELNDMVKAECNDCRGCSKCCRGMGDTIKLDPYDINRLTEATGKSFEQLLANEVELNVVDGMILPNIKMVDGHCPFLNDEGRCGIHGGRPGFCRLFPLGRYYEEDGGFRYFLQVHECDRAGHAKVKVNKWIDTPEPARYDRYVADWHKFQKDIQIKVIGALFGTDHLDDQSTSGAPATSGMSEEDIAIAEETARNISMLVLNTLDITRYEESKDFYQQFYGRLARIRDMLGV